LKILLILRHGKASRRSPSGQDRDRPLRERGRQAVSATARRLLELGISPDVILTSPARRTHETADVAAKAAEWTCPVLIEPRLYHGTAGAGLTVVRQLPETADVVLISAHEPMCSELVAMLSSAAAAPDFPPASIAVLDASVDKWSEMEAGTASLRLLETPRQLSARRTEAASIASFPAPVGAPKTGS